MISPSISDNESRSVTSPPCSAWPASYFFAASLSHRARAKFFIASGVFRLIRVSPLKIRLVSTVVDCGGFVDPATGEVGFGGSEEGTSDGTVGELDGASDAVTFNV